MIAVKEAPKRNPKNGLLLNLLISLESLEEAIVFKVEDTTKSQIRKDLSQQELRYKRRLDQLRTFFTFIIAIAMRNKNN